MRVYKQRVMGGIFVLLGSFAPFAHGASALILRCRGRADMTVSLTNYGLATEQWGDSFMVAAGYQKAKLHDGSTVRVYRFQNGDQWFWDVKAHRHFFFFLGRPVLEPCTAGAEHALRPTLLPEVKGQLIR